MNVFGDTEIEIMLATASKLVRRPVLREKTMQRSMILSERLNPVRECWRSQMSDPAMRTSDAALRMLIALDS